LHVVLGGNRILAWEGCLNARDLGGYPTGDGRQTTWGAVVRSDHPGKLSPAGREALVAYGIRTIVDLRLPHELEEYPHPFADSAEHGVLYAHRSFIRPGVPLPPNLDDLSMLENYIGIIDRFQDSVAAVMQTIATAPDGGVLVHCAIGKDRTGITCAMLLDLAGVDRETIGLDYALTDECLAPERDEWLENGPGEREEREQFLLKHMPRAEVIVAVLEHLDQRHGGTGDYLAAGGVADQDLQRLKQRLLG
jgi:protein-tyrosine phosphatase